MISISDENSTRISGIESFTEKSLFLDESDSIDSEMGLAEVVF
jgi:hypothetical protein